MTRVPPSTKRLGFVIQLPGSKKQRRALTRGAQLAVSDGDVQLHLAGARVSGLGGAVPLGLPRWGRGDLGQHLEVLQDDLQ